MHKCKYTDRLEIKNGKITRIIHAKYKSKNYENEMDVMKHDEDGNYYCRHIYYNSLAGYGIVFKNEYISRNSFYGNIFIDHILPYYKADKSIPLGCFNQATDEDLKIITDKYKEFKYVLKKWKCRNLERILTALTIWKKNKEIEILLACGLEKIAFCNAFYQLSERKKNEFRIFLKNNLNLSEIHSLNYSDILKCLKHNYEVKKYVAIKICRNYKLSDKETDYAIKKFEPNEISLYKYYLSNLTILNKNLNDDFWHYPTNFKKQNKKISEELKNYYSNLDKIKNEQYRKKSKIYENYFTVIDDFEIFVPQDISEIRRQAEVLNQCLITCDYINKVINNECVLVFIQKNKIPIATAEIQKNNYIAQFYCDELGRTERMYPTDKMKNAMNKWLANKNILAA